VFGDDYRTHEITGLPLRRSVGALDDDAQALTLHISLIKERNGAIAAGVGKKKIEQRIAAKSAAGWAEVDQQLPTFVNGEINVKGENG
jgi:hypothetical protein